jgi:hypothetical protein
MKVEFEIDAKEFTSTLQEYAEVSHKDAQDVVADRAGKLAFQLFKDFKATAPKVSLLKSLPQKLGYRIKRKFKGDTVAQEIARRVRARFAAASGWLPAVWRFSRGKPVLRIKNPKGRTEIDLTEPSVTIVNSMKEAVADETRHGIIQKSIDAQTADMKVYINRKLEQRAKQFSAK